MEKLPRDFDLPTCSPEDDIVETKVCIKASDDEFIKAMTSIRLRLAKSPLNVNNVFRTPIITNEDARFERIRLEASYSNGYPSDLPPKIPTQKSSTCDCGAHMALGFKCFLREHSDWCKIHDEKITREISDVFWD